MAKYRAVAGAEPPVPPSAVPGTDEMPAYMTLGAQYGIADEMDIAANSGQQTIEQEYQAYITAVTSPKTINILGFWEVIQCGGSYFLITDTTFQANQAAFPTLFSMAMDYLPIQASAVPCERIFSSSSETDTKKRNRISPLLMEALQMLKFYLKKDRLNFTKIFCARCFRTISKTAWILSFGPSTMTRTNLRTDRYMLVHLAPPVF
jgi:hypothetical protein